MRYRLFLLLLSFGASLQAQQADAVEIDHPGDSVITSQQAQLDSLQLAFYQGADSLKNACKARLNRIDSAKTSLRARVDSLNNLRLPTEQYTARLDSLQQLRQKTVDSLSAKLERLRSKTTGRIDKLDLPPKVREKAAAVTGNIDGFKLPVQDLNIPAVDLQHGGLPNLDGLNSSIPSPVGEVGNVPGVEGLSGKLGGISGLGEKANGLGDEAQQITGENNVEKISSVIENKAVSAAGVDGQLKAAGEVDPLQSAMPQPDVSAEGVKEKVQQKAINHFAGKEEQLKAAMEKMAKLKQKYSSLNSLSEIPKRRPNEMRGKPFVERLVPGVALQIHKQRDLLMVDFNPYTGYRFTGKFTAGLGWNYRLGYNLDHYRFANRLLVSGPRSFAEYRIGKGFSPRVELELMRAFVPPMFHLPHDHGQLEWVWGAFAGIKKEYRFVKNVRGTALIMIRVFNPAHKSPYPDVINARVGFEFPMKKKKRNEGEDKP